MLMARGVVAGVAPLAAVQHTGGAGAMLDAVEDLVAAGIQGLCPVPLRSPKPITSCACNFTTQTDARQNLAPANDVQRRGLACRMRLLRALLRQLESRRVRLPA